MYENSCKDLEIDMNFEDEASDEGLFFSSNTKFLTNHGMKFSYEITEEDKLLTLSLFGDLTEVEDFELEFKTFSRGYDNRINNYSEIITNKKINVINSFEANGGVNHCLLSNTSKFYINNTEYSEVNLEDSLLLSLIITTFFNKSSNEVLTYNKKIQMKYIYNIFRLYHKHLGLYFPYIKEFQNYEFKSSLYMNDDRLESLLVKYFSLFKEIVKNIDKYHVFRGSDYKALFFKSFTLANLVQVMLSLCDYSTKLVYDSKYELFRLTYVSNFEASFTCRNEHTRKVFKEENNMVKVSLPNHEDYLVTSQTIDGVTTISLVQPNS